MTDRVVSLDAARQAREVVRVYAGHGYCTACHHEWECEHPAGTIVFDCPKCLLPRGLWKYPFGAAEGDAVLTCTECGCEALTAYRRKGRLWVRCMGCGNDLTETFFEG